MVVVQVGVDIGGSRNRRSISLGCITGQDVVYLTINCTLSIVFGILVQIVLDLSCTVLNTSDMELVVPQVPVDPFQTLEVPFARFSSEYQSVRS